MQRKNFNLVPLILDADVYDTHTTFTGFCAYLFTYVGLVGLAQLRVDFISASVIDVHMYSFR